MKDKKQRSKQILIGLVVLVFMAVACSSCTYAKPAYCTYLIGDSSNSKPYEVIGVVYPGQEPSTTQNVNTYYIPCNSRNYLVVKGEKYNANGQRIGDQYEPLYAYTSSGVKIEILAEAFWTPNQSDQAMRDFWTVCDKYDCATTSISGDAKVNNSMPGWNSMLGENFGPAFADAARIGAGTMDDKIWQTHAPKLYEDLAKNISNAFADQIRKRFGFTEDVFCASGASGWPDPSKPGEGEYNCLPVRINVTDVQVVYDPSNSTSEAQAQLNAITRANARAMYGDLAEYFLGTMDLITKCKDSGTMTCIFNIGNPGDLPVTVDAPTPAATETATATP